MSILTDTIKAIDDDYLVGLSNKGTVKRAYKDLEGMTVDPVIEEEAISFDFDGIACRLVMPLSESTCSCPQIGTCRHIVALVLAAKAKLAQGGGDPDSGASEGEAAGNGTADNEPDIAKDAVKEETAKENDDKATKKTAEETVSDVAKETKNETEVTENSDGKATGSGKKKAKSEEPSESKTADQSIDLAELARKEIEAFPITDLFKKMSPTALAACLERVESNVIPTITKKQIVTVEDDADQSVVKLMYPLSASGCSCHKAGLCPHKLKALLFVKVTENESDLAKLKEFLSEKTEETFDPELTLQTEQRIKSVLDELMGAGLARLSPAMKDQFFELALTAHNAGMAEAEGNLRELGNLIERYQAKSASVSNENIMEKTVTLYRSKMQTGEFRTEYMPIRNLDLIGLGSRNFHSSEGYAGQIAYFIEKKTGEYYTFTSARADFYDGKRRGNQGGTPAPWNLAIPFARFAEARIKIRYGKVNKNHRLSSSSETDAEFEKRSASVIRELEPFVYEDFQAIWRDYFQDATESRPEEYQKLVLIRPEKFTDVKFDRISQSLQGFLEDPFGRKITISLQYKKEEAMAIKSIEKMVAKAEKNDEKPPVFLGTVYISEERLMFYPIETVDELGEKVVNLGSNDFSEKTSDLMMDEPAYRKAGVASNAGDDQGIPDDAVVLGEEHIYHSEEDMKQTLAFLKECQVMLSDLFTSGLTILPEYLSGRLSEVCEQASKRGLIRLSGMLGELESLMEQQRHGMTETEELRAKKVRFFSDASEYVRIGIELAGRELAGTRLNS